MFIIRKPSKRNFDLFYYTIIFSIIFDVTFYILDFNSLLTSSTYIDSYYLEMPYLKSVVLFFLNHSWAMITLLSIILISSILVLFQKFKKTSLIFLFISLTLLINCNPYILQYHDFIRLMALFWFILIEIDPKYSENYVFLFYIAFSFIYLQPMFLRDPSPWLIDFTGLSKTLSTENKHTLLTPYLLQMPLLLKILSPFAYIFEWVIPMLAIWSKGKIRYYSVIALLAFHLGIALTVNLMTFTIVVFACIFFLIPFDEKTISLNVTKFKNRAIIPLLIIMTTLPYKIIDDELPTNLNNLLSFTGQHNHWRMYSKWVPNIKFTFKDQNHIPYKFSSVRNWRWETSFIYVYLIKNEDNIDLFQETLFPLCSKLNSKDRIIATYTLDDSIQDYTIDCNQKLE